MDLFGCVQLTAKMGPADIHRDYLRVGLCYSSNVYEKMVNFLVRDTGIYLVSFYFIRFLSNQCKSDDA